jgi:hypothetical protein
MKTNNFSLFLIINFLFGLVIILTTHYLKTEELVFNFYSERLAEDQIQKLIENQKKWQWIAYIAIPLVTIIRSSLVALCLSVGMFFYDMENKISFKKFFRIAIFGELILVLVGFFKFGYFYFIKTNYTLEDIQQYYPLSYINFLDIEKIQPWLVYPLQSINLFEIAYFFVLVYGMYKLLKNNYSKSFEITTISYGTGLLIWFGLVMFLTLNFT